MSRNFSENKERSIALLRKAISALEEETADAGPVIEPAKQSTATPVIEAQESKTALKADEIRMLRPRRWGGIALRSRVASYGTMVARGRLNFTLDSVAGSRRELGVTGDIPGSS